MSNATTKKKKLSFAEMAAAGTSITVSSLPTFSPNHVTTPMQMPILAEQLSLSLPSVPQSKNSFSSSNTTASTDGNSTSSSSSESVSPKSEKVPSSVPKTALAPPKNPWKTELVLGQSIAATNGMAKILPTPAESRGMRPVAVADVAVASVDSSAEKRSVEIIPEDKGSSNKESANASTSTAAVENPKPSDRPLQQKEELVGNKDRPKQSLNAKSEKSKEQTSEKLSKNPSTTVKKQPKDESGKNQRSKSPAKKSNNATQQNKTSNIKKPQSPNKNKAAKNKKQNKRKNKNQMKTQANANALMYTPTTQELTVFKKAAVAQVEYFFSTDELVKNIYMRKQMDFEGYLPAAIVFNFPSILSYCVPYYDLLEALKDNKNVEVDFDNQCLRLQGGEEEYKKWLFPNEDGALGCPKWFIPKEDVEDDSEANFEALHEFVDDEKIVQSEKEEKNVGDVAVDGGNQ